MKGRFVFKNVIMGGGTRFIIMALGIVLPRLMITSFGSEVNGLVSTVSQIFAYLALLEAGIGASTINALYQPLNNKDNLQVCEVMTEARRYYRKICVIYGFAIIAFSVIYPLVVSSFLNKWLIFGVIILQGASNFISYYFCAVYNQLLTADGRKYVSDNIYFIVYVLSTAAKIILMYLGYNIIAVQTSALLCTLLTILLTWIYIKKRYPSLNLKTKPQKKYLKERNAFIVHEFSGAVFNNTALIVVSSFCGFAMASVYSVYNLIYSSLNTLLSSVTAGLNFVFGKNLQKGEKEMRKIYDVYNSLYIAGVFALFTVAVLFADSFIKLYARGVTDINYSLPGLALLMAVVSLLSGVRMVGAKLIAVSGHADKTKVRSIIEAIINIAASIIFVLFFGVYGVLLGSIVALLYRANDIIIYTNKKILNRSPLKDYIVIFVFSVAFVGIYFVFGLFNVRVDSYVTFLFKAVIVLFICFVVYLLVAYFTNIKIYNKYLRGLMRH